VPAEVIGWSWDVLACTLVLFLYVRLQLHAAVHICTVFSFKTRLVLWSPAAAKRAYSVLPIFPFLSVLCHMMTFNVKPGM